MIAVIGGGVVGAVVAFELQRRGLEVTVFEARLPGAATPASAGMLAPGPEGLSGAALEDARAALALWPDLARALEAHGRGSVGLRFGMMRARSVPAHEDDLEAFPGEGWVNPLAVRDAALKTVPVLQQQVLRLEPVERGVRLHSARHTHTARAAVIAAGAWSANFGLPVYPLRGQALLLSAAPYPTPLYAAGRYAVPRAGRTYLGASVRATWDTRIEAQETEALLHGLEGIFPHLRGAAVLEARVGLRPFCDQGPLEGAHPSLPGVWCATGHGRHGTLLAPLTARRVADAVQQALAALSA